jgi:uncharacterized protein with ParB-like and HNH nuclease domain
MSSELDINTNEHTVENLISQNIKFEVPDYQRPYAWGRDEWESFWDDLTRLEEGDRHFLGSVVLIEEDTPMGELDIIKVVDGQQRLAIITVLISIIRRVHKSTDEIERRCSDKD